MAEAVQQPVGSYQMPSQVSQTLHEDSYQIVRVLTEHNDLLNVIRSEMRGEQLFADHKTGDRYWVQIDKPMFIKLDKNDKPIKVINPRTGKEEFVNNDEAINEVLSILKLCGLNPITPLTNITDDEIRDDLLEMEAKIAMLLAVNRKKWGLEKASYPSVVGKIKILIKDARYRAKDGTVLRALRTITSRVEHSTEEQKKKMGIGEKIKSPFN